MCSSTTLQTQRFVSFCFYLRCARCHSIQQTMGHRPVVATTFHACEVASLFFKIEDFELDLTSNLKGFRRSEKSQLMNSRIFNAIAYELIYALRRFCVEIACNHVVMSQFHQNIWLYSWRSAKLDLVSITVFDHFQMPQSSISKYILSIWSIPNKLVPFIYIALRL